MSQYQENLSPEKGGNESFLQIVLSPCKGAKSQSALSCVDMMTHCRPLTQMAQSRLA